MVSSDPTWVGAAAAALKIYPALIGAKSPGRLQYGRFARMRSQPQAIPAEFERDLIRQRTMTGLAAARARGRRGGPPRMMTMAKLRTAMTRMADPENAASDVAHPLAVSPSTLYAYIDVRGQPKEIARQLISTKVRVRTRSGTAVKGVAQWMTEH